MFRATGLTVVRSMIAFPMTDSTWNSVNESAILTEMSQGNLAQEILRQLSTLNEKIDNIEERVSDKFDKITDQLGGDEGIRERLTILEVRFEKLKEKSLHPPATVSQRPLKDHAATAGIASAVVVALEAASQFFLKK